MRTIVLLLVLLITIIPIPSTASTQGVAPSITYITPDRTYPESEAIVSGLSYSNGSEVVIFKGNTEYARVIAIPTGPVFSAGVSPVRSTASEFRFVIPWLPTDLYNIRLYHPDMGLSNPVPFKISPIVESITQDGNQIIVSGKGLRYTDQKVVARMLPDLRVIPVTVIPLRTIAQVAGLVYITEVVPKTSKNTNIVVDAYYHISGNGLPTYSKGTAFVDTNYNGIHDPWEPIQPIATSDTGEFSADLFISASLVADSIVLVDIPRLATGSYMLELFALVGDNIIESSYRNGVLKIVKE